MKIEIFCLCDAATDNRGKLNILGTFDQIFSPKMPMVHPSCAIAIRMRFDKVEEGEHALKIQLVNPDGLPILPPMEGKVHPRMGADTSSIAINVILNFQHLKFEEFAEYQLNLSLDNQSITTLPLRVRELPLPQPS